MEQLYVESNFLLKCISFLVPNTIVRIMNQFTQKYISYTYGSIKVGATFC